MTEQLVSSTTSMNTSNKVERIYIGGIDPSRGLTVKDILGRLESSLGDQIEIRDLHEGSFFCYVNAIVKVASDEDTKEAASAATAQTPAQAPALQAIAKLYNNVKWKGCKLKVEPARTHFLDRLAQERQDRQQALDDAAALSAAATSSASQSTPHPRHLKIRKGYGETSWAIDTRPCRVTEWTTFRKMTRKFQKDRDKSLVALHKAHCNRGVHLTFPNDDQDEDEKDGTSGAKSSSVVRNERVAAQDDDESESSIDSGSGSGSSDDDDDDNDVDSTDERMERTGTDEKTSPSQLPHTAALKSKSSAYVWSESDDEDSDSDESEESVAVMQTNPNPNLKTRLPTAVVDASLDEFAAAMDDDDYANDSDDDQQQEQERDDESSRDNSSDEDDSVAPSARKVVVFADDSKNLKQDVETNLNVLAGLFPDMGARQPRAVDINDNDDDDSSSTNPELDHTAPSGDGGAAGSKSKAKPQAITEPSSWNASGQMLRYDPTKESAKQFVISVKTQDEEHQAQDDNDDSNSNTKAELAPPTDMSTGDLEEEDSIDSKDDEEEEDDEEEKEEVPKEDDVYEQGKLEDVFREARKVQEAPAKVITTNTTTVADETKKQDESGGFSFSFNVPAESKNLKEQAPGAFSFSFGLPTTASSSEKLVQAEHMDEATRTRQRDAEAASESVTMAEQECPPVKRQRRGFVFPEQDLDKYVNIFYSLTEGRHMMDDLASFRREAKVQDHWAKEKLALTQDWKRKRKYAQSRNKKKFGN
jgi:hypothetical protein